MIVNLFLVILAFLFVRLSRCYIHTHNQCLNVAIFSIGNSATGTRSASISILIKDQLPRLPTQHSISITGFTLASTTLDFEAKIGTLSLTGVSFEITAYDGCQITDICV